MIGDPGDLAGSRVSKTSASRATRCAPRSTATASASSSGCSATPACAAWSASRRRSRSCSCATTTRRAPRTQVTRDDAPTLAPTGTAGAPAPAEQLQLLRNARRCCASTCAATGSCCRCGCCCCRCRWPRSTSAASRAVYPTAADRAGFAASIMASPAQRALYGNVYNDSLGAVGIWKAGMFHVLIAVAVILTVIRHTRADEETGRTELIDSTAVGRYASLTAALLLAAGRRSLHRCDRRGRSADARRSRSPGRWLSVRRWPAPAWCSPRSPRWPRSCRRAPGSPAALAFAVLACGVHAARRRRCRVEQLPVVAVAAGLVAAGSAVRGRPLVGAVVAPRHHRRARRRGVPVARPPRRRRRVDRRATRPARAGASLLHGAFGLAWRLDRGALVLWTVGLCLYGLLIGSVVHGIGDEIGDSARPVTSCSRLGGTDALEQAFIAVAFTMLGMVAAAFAISLTLRLHQEESTPARRAGAGRRGRVGPVGWQAIWCSRCWARPSAMLIAGLIAGLTYGAAAGDVGGKLPTVLGSAPCSCPRSGCSSAVTVAVFGLLPRFTPVAWGVLVAFIALYLLGLVGRTHRSGCSTSSRSPTFRRSEPAISPRCRCCGCCRNRFALITLGVIAFRRRDLR